MIHAGILRENKILVVHIPITQRAFVFRVKNVVNRGLHTINYGPLPIAANYPFSGLVGGVIPAPATGVIPAGSFVPLGGELTFPFSGAYDEKDMWYIPEEWNERLFHVILHVIPAWLRIEITIPKGVSQGRFQREKVTTGVEKSFGWVRGRIETVHLPGIRYGYRFANDTNLYTHTGAIFNYGEYIIETPRDAGLIFDILSRPERADAWISLPIQNYDESIKRALLETYGIEGFTIYGIHERAKAITEYTALINRVKV